MLFAADGSGTVSDGRYTLQAAPGDRQHRRPEEQEVQAVRGRSVAAVGRGCREPAAAGPGLEADGSGGRRPRHSPRLEGAHLNGGLLQHLHAGLTGFQHTCIVSHKLVYSLPVGGIAIASVWQCALSSPHIT